MIDVLIVGAFVIYSITTGFVMQKKASRGLEEYFLAGRTLKGWKAGVSMAATQYAADTPLLVMGLVATAGLFSLWRLWVYAIAFLLMGFLLGPSWRRAGVLTDAELTEIRYSGRLATVLRAIKAVHMGTIVNCTVMAMVLLAATRIAEPFLIWHDWFPAWIFEPVRSTLEHLQITFATGSVNDPTVWIRSADNFISILMIVSFTTLYSTSGGLRSVVATDVAQFMISMIATFAFAWVIVERVGGLGMIPQKLETLYGGSATQALLSFGPVHWDSAVFLFVCVLSVQWFAQVNSDGTGYLAQRTMACATDRDAKKAALTFTVLQIIFRSLFWIPIALSLLILYPAIDLPVLGTSSEAFRVARETTFATGIKDFLPPGLRGLMLTGMLAALASTIDTHLNWGASYWANDLYKRILMEGIVKRKPAQKELVWIARASNLGILLIALLIMANLSSIQTAWHLTLLFGSGLGVVLILRWMWYRINLWSEITAATSSLVFAPVLLIYFPDMSEGVRLLLMLGISTVSVILVTFVTKPEDEKILKAFYLRVKPPGFWSPFDPSSDSLDQLKRGLAATALACASVFLILIGGGKLLISFPIATSTIPVVMIVMGFILVPVWWRLGFESR